MICTRPIFCWFQVFTWLVCTGFSLTVQADTLQFKLVKSSSESFAEPHDLVLSPDGKQLYVADNGNDRIVVLDPDTLAVRHTIAAGEVSQPHDVVFDQQGRLLVADTGNSRIAVFALSGKQATLVNELSESLSRPEGVAVHPDGSVLATGAASGNLVVYRAGKHVGEIRGLASPHDVEIAPDGNVWIADTGHNRMIQVNRALDIIAERKGSEYRFNGPRYMDFDSSGRLYVADKYSHQVKILSTDGRLVQILGQQKPGKGEGVFDRPEGVEIRGRDVWISDTYNDRIVRYQIIE